ncbi:MAG: alpha/beta hydrolase [Syntrophobacteraceae bacterium]
MELPRELSQLDGFIAVREAAHPDLVHGTEKLIIWHQERRNRTSLALVYVHGFGASRQEMSPVLEKLGEEVGANVFFTRLRGHGLGPDGLKGITVKDWVDDLSEALAVGRAIGDRVVLVGASTGAALAVWAASKGARIDGLILVSPNFNPASRKAAVVAWPWGRLWVRLFLGDYRQFTPVSELQERYWTCRQHTDGLFAMMGAVLLARSADLSKVAQPTLMLYTEKDDVVSLSEMKKGFDRIGSTEKEVRRVDNAAHHILAGAATSPETVDEVREIMAELLSRSIASRFPSSLA